MVVWIDDLTPTDRDILAQRFNSAGDKVGPEIVVSSRSLNDTEPAVAMDSQGDFVVSWTQTQLNGDTNVLARRFDSAGNPQGAIVPVGVGTFKEHDSDVAMDSLGLFTVAYVRDTNNNNPDVFAKVYNAFGDLLNVVSVATTGRAETSPSIAMTPDGRFDVAWEDASSSNNHDIKMNSYSWNGGLLATYAISSSASTDFSAERRRGRQLQRGGGVVAGRQRRLRRQGAAGQRSSASWVPRSTSPALPHWRRPGRWR